MTWTGDSIVRSYGDHAHRLRARFVRQAALAVLRRIGRWRRALPARGPRPEPCP